MLRDKVASLLLHNWLGKHSLNIWNLTGVHDVVSME